MGLKSLEPGPFPFGIIETPQGMLSIILWVLDIETLGDWDYKTKPLERRHFLGYLDILNVVLMSAHHPKSDTGNHMSSSFHAFSTFLIY